jgi:hypothetical protein
VGGRNDAAVTHQARGEPSAANAAKYTSSSPTVSGAETAWASSVREASAQKDA